jgi:hypothetical protein
MIQLRCFWVSLTSSGGYFGDQIAERETRIRRFPKEETDFEMRIS